ncbi:MAG: hypothetical protein K6T76_14620 [Alicyclobacillus mali]|uniref:hypothetical protein n=1 Tax=Alicyclobacillus mali (ex Roth et al. 2021) TaxID=1123961 RepID=UPI0023F35C95|nr:hypothetical protein [Alicyclobacillus mali (ex Roth et al. 2021)]MCL6490152.1 hypothetical protein [Alicyclobacillus mali (ex Roth et al. 2021)]
MNNSVPPFLSQAYLQNLQSAFLQAFYYVIQREWHDYVIVACLILISELIKLLVRGHDRNIIDWLIYAEWILLAGTFGFSVIG